MESSDQRDDDQDHGSGSPPGRESQSVGGGPAVGRQAVATDDPAVTSGSAFASEARKHPDQTTVIETSGIRRPDEASNPRVLMVPIERPAPPGRSDSGAGEAETSQAEGESGHKNQPKQGGHSHKGTSKEGKEHDDERGGSGDRQASHGSRPSQGPSLTRMLLYAGVVALICGVAGAWGYSYFFGSSKSDDQKSSGKTSDSKKKSDSGDSSDSGKDSDSGEDSDISRKGQAELAQAEEAWLAAVKELHQSQEAAKAARRSEEETKAVLDFFKRTLLSGDRSGDGALSEAFWSGGQGKDVTLRQALDATEPQVADAFADRPQGEASVREMLGVAYLNVGKASRAVQEFERALALREAVQGANQPETASCRNQLAVAYRLAGRTSEAGRLFDRNTDSPARASSLAIRGAMLLREKKPAEAELKLRECLNIRQKIGPDDWTTFDAKSSLGEALLDQHKLAEAEPLLVSGYEGLKQREDKIPSQGRAHVTRALERLVRLYDAWGKTGEATRWRKELASAGTQPAGPP